MLFSGLSFQIPKGKAILLMGENGSGKSTLLKLLSGILKPRAGSIEFNGKALTHASNFGKLHYHSQNAGDNILGLNAEADFWLWQMALGKEDKPLPSDDIYQRFALKGLESKVISQLSNGEKRAVALMPLPMLPQRFWLLDEPFSGLDYQRAKTLQEVIRHKLRIDRSLLMISHQMEIPIDEFDEVWLLDNGIMQRITV